MARIQRLCSVEGCERKVHCKSLCKTHYRRVQRLGSVELPPKRSVEESFWARVNKSGPIHPTLKTHCWLWTGATRPNGYGDLNRKDWGRRLSHRFAYELIKGEIPEGLQLDHLCRTRDCVNPDHLEPVTCQVNILRGESLPAQNAKKTHCPKGHVYNLKIPKSKPPFRYCRQCTNDARRERRRVEKEKREALKTHCYKGHPFEIKINKHGEKRRICHICLKANQKRHYAKKMQEAQSG